MKINGISYDFKNFKIDGNKNYITRFVRKNVDTLGGYTRTISTLHYKRFKLDIVNLTETDIQNITNIFGQNSFNFLPEPYENITYTVKVIRQGQLVCRDYTNQLYDWTGLEFEVI